MPILKEQWIPTIIEKLFADNSFASRSADHSAFVAGTKVHVPNAGSLPTVTVNNTTYPVKAAERTDADLDYELDKYEVGPVRVGNIEEVQLSYDKRNSVVSGVRQAVTETVHSTVLSAWIAGCTKATQKAVAAKFGKAVVMEAKTAFDKQDIPQDGRCWVLTPTAYNELLLELSESEQFAFSASADSAKGVVGKYLGFDFYMRSVIDTAASNKTTAFAWHQECVSRALGPVDILEDEHRADYFGDIISATMLAGGAAIRTDGAGIFKVTSA